MAVTYQERVRSLVSNLDEVGKLHEAQEALRSLVDRIVLQPSPETGKLDIMLEGALSGLLALALFHKQRTQRHSQSEVSDNIDELVLVAGARFGHYFRSPQQTRIYR